MGFWETVKIEIRKQGTTQEWVAGKVGTRRDSFSRWASRETIPRADEAYRIARALNTTVEYLVDGDDGTEYLRGLPMFAAAYPAESRGIGLVADPGTEYDALARKIRALPPEDVEEITAIVELKAARASAKTKHA